MRIVASTLPHSQRSIMRWLCVTPSSQQNAFARDIIYVDSDTSTGTRVSRTGCAYVQLLCSSVHSVRRSVKLRTHFPRVHGRVYPALVKRFLADCDNGSTYPKSSEVACASVCLRVCVCNVIVGLIVVKHLNGSSSFWRERYHITTLLSLHCIKWASGYAYENESKASPELGCWSLVYWTLKMFELA